jgi:enamine deaminase RidA (YjgF/YER057c/UK114 family)
VKPEFIPYDPPIAYSRACVWGNLIFLAGEDGKDMQTRQVQGHTMQEQAELAFQKLQEILEGLGSSLEYVVHVTTYLKDARDREGWNVLRAKYMPQRPPGEIICGVDLADPRMLIEIAPIAVIPERS